jgi:predicted nucleotidyltransferase
MAKPPLEEIVRTIVEAMDPRRIVLFGSYANGTAGPESDVDLIVEMETPLQKPYREIAVGKLFRKRDWSLDVFVYTSAEVEELRSRVGSIVYGADREGRVLYERV